MKPFLSEADSLNQSFEIQLMLEIFYLKMTAGLLDWQIMLVIRDEKALFVSQRSFMNKCEL